MNINIHKKIKHWNLGLTRISGFLPAEKAAAFVTEKVVEFVSKIGDRIVCSVMDGTSKILKFRKLVTPMDLVYTPYNWWFNKYYTRGLPKKSNTTHLKKQTTRMQSVATNLNLTPKSVLCGHG